MLKLKTATFIKSASRPNDFYFSNAPQIAIAGKSNVGKSSFINFIANQDRLARTSNTPGRTQLINYFDFGAFILTDLPGYGYAKVAKTNKEAWGALIEQYLLKEPNLKRIILLVDIRHDPTEQDIELAEFFYYHRLPFNVIATKSDKLSKMQIKLNMSRIAMLFNVGIDNIFDVSSTAKTGKEKVNQLIADILSVEDIKLEDVVGEFEQEDDADDVVLLNGKKEMTESCEKAAGHVGQED